MYSNVWIVMNFAGNYTGILVSTILSNNNEFIIQFHLKFDVEWSQRVYNYSFYSVYWIKLYSGRTYVDFTLDRFFALFLA